MNDVRTQSDRRDAEPPTAADGPTRRDPQAMGDQTHDDVTSSLPPGAGTKPAGSRGDVDRLQPYDEQVGGLRMSDAEVPPSQLEDPPPGAGSGEDPGASAPGLGVVDDDEQLPAAPEPNEPA